MTLGAVFLTELGLDVYNKFIDNVNTQRPQFKNLVAMHMNQEVDEYNNGIISQCFNWESSPEGRDFWNTLHIKLIKKSGKRNYLYEEITKDYEYKLDKLP